MTGYLLECTSLTKAGPCVAGMFVTVTSSSGKTGKKRESAQLLRDKKLTHYKYSNNT